jgi:hypothetical protein
MVVILLLFLFAVSYNNRASSSVVTFLVSPSDAVIKANGKTIGLNKQRQGLLKQGTYKIEVSRTDFKTTSKDLVVTDTKPQSIIFLLSPLNEAGKAFLATKDQQLYRESLGTQDFQNRSDALLKNHKITELLPYVAQHFRVDYGVSVKEPDNQDAIALYISADDPSYHQWALDWMRSQKYDPSDFEIIFNRTANELVD